MKSIYKNQLHLYIYQGQTIWLFNLKENTIINSNKNKVPKKKSSKDIHNLMKKIMKLWDIKEDLKNWRDKWVEIIIIKDILIFSQIDHQIPCNFNKIPKRLMKDLGKLIFKFLWKNIAKSKMYMWDEKRKDLTIYQNVVWNLLQYGTEAWVDKLTNRSEKKDSEWKTLTNTETYNIAEIALWMPPESMGFSINDSRTNVYQDI